MWRIVIQSVLMPSSGILPLAAGLLHHPWSIDAHDYEFMEVAVVASGKGTQLSIHGSQELARGSVVIVRPGAWHAFDHCKEMMVCNCVFDEELLREDLAWVLRDPRLEHLLHSGLMSPQHKGVLVGQVDEEATQKCLLCGEDLSAAIAATPQGGRTEQLGRLALFLASLGSVDVARHVAHSERPAQHPAVRQAIRLLESDIRHQWTVPELAAKLNIDASYLSRLFRGATALPPLAYYTRHRLQMAAAMLIRTEEAVGNIAERVGWTDQNHFARRFKSHFGVSPSRYREQFREQKAKSPQ